MTISKTRFKQSIFVSPRGNDQGNDGSREYPVRTVSRAMVIAAERDFQDVVIEKGRYYEENLKIIPGINIWGSFDDFDDSKGHFNYNIVPGWSKKIKSRNLGDYRRYTLIITDDLQLDQVDKETSLNNIIFQGMNYDSALSLDQLGDGVYGVGYTLSEDSKLDKLSFHNIMLIANCIHVSLNGDNTCSGECWESAVQSIGKAIEIGQSKGIFDILIEAGIYKESMEFIQGINLWGSYCKVQKTRERRSVELTYETIANANRNLDKYTTHTVIQCSSYQPTNTEQLTVLSNIVIVSDKVDRRIKVADYDHGIYGVLISPKKPESLNRLRLQNVSWITRCIHVSAKYGNDNAAGCQKDPVATIKCGMELANKYGIKNILLTRGEYSEDIDFTAGGVNLWGSYDEQYSSFSTLSASQIASASRKVPQVLLRGKKEREKKNNYVNKYTVIKNYKDKVDRVRQTFTLANIIMDGCRFDQSKAEKYDQGVYGVIEKSPQYYRFGAVRLKNVRLLPHAIYVLCDKLKNTLEKKSDGEIGTISNPVRTISEAILLAEKKHYKEVLVSYGNYKETVAVKPGVNIWGSFSRDFDRVYGIGYELIKSHKYDPRYYSDANHTVIQGEPEGDAVIIPQAKTSTVLSNIVFLGVNISSLEKSKIEQAKEEDLKISEKKDRVYDFGQGCYGVSVDADSANSSIKLFNSRKYWGFKNVKFIVPPIYVDGNSESDGNGTRGKPYKKIGHAIKYYNKTNNAASTILVATGLYEEHVHIPPGVHITGGFSNNFSEYKSLPLESSKPDKPTLFSEHIDPADYDKEYTVVINQHEQWNPTITAHNINEYTSITNMVVIGQSTTKKNRTSYGICMSNSADKNSEPYLHLQDIKVLARPGVTPDQAPDGANGTRHVTCGGEGGKVNSSDITNDNWGKWEEIVKKSYIPAKGGDNGNNGHGGGAGGSGARTLEHKTEKYLAGLTGKPGTTGGNGSSGKARCRSLLGSIDTSSTKIRWKGEPGENGKDGTPGGGGGGGGAGASYCWNEWSRLLLEFGGEGGKGGMGGGEGFGGAGGNYGGASIGIALKNIVIAADNVAIIKSSGGQGGAAGSGGKGMEGENGKEGQKGTIYWHPRYKDWDLELYTGKGGKGGKGGEGGNGGPGAGGTGGASIGVALIDNARIEKQGIFHVAGGVPGKGGHGGKEGKYIRGDHGCNAESVNEYKFFTTDKK
ncbi:hypothetical protein [Microbulbifer epialgicus]|uniref:DUF1565 domain-containing protein n=1 Tax=Microbulbifer epialgicus TaxID=393907 RepID=A0ABV4NV24_9GAMM